MAGAEINPWPVFVAFFALFVCIVIAMLLQRYHLHAIPETGPDPRRIPTESTLNPRRIHAESMPNPCPITLVRASFAHAAYAHFARANRGGFQ